MEKIAGKIADWVIDTGGDPEYREVYIYGAVALLGEIISDILLVTVSIFLGFPLEMMLWIAFFTPLHAKVGSWHANGPVACIVTSTLLGLVSVFVSTLLVHYPVVLLVEIVVSVVIVLAFAPVIHKHKPQTKERIALAREQAIWITAISCAIILQLLSMGAMWAAQAAGMGMLCAVALCLMGKFLNKAPAE